MLRASDELKDMNALLNSKALTCVNLESVCWQSSYEHFKENTDVIQ